ncbi:unnamed protein product, partial [Oppiella nova]
KAFNGIHVADFATLIPAFVKRLLRVTITGKIGFFFETTRHILATRRAHPSDKHNDFIQLMMEAMLTDKVTRDEQDTNEAHYVNEGAEELEVERKALTRDDPKSGAKQLTENEIVAQA